MHCYASTELQCTVLKEVAFFSTLHQTGRFLGDLPSSVGFASLQENLESFVGDRLESLRKECHEAQLKKNHWHNVTFKWVIQLDTRCMIICQGFSPWKINVWSLGCCPISWPPAKYQVGWWHTSWPQDAKSYFQDVQVKSSEKNRKGCTRVDKWEKSRHSWEKKNNIQHVTSCPRCFVTKVLCCTILSGILVRTGYTVCLPFPTLHANLDNMPRSQSFKFSGPRGCVPIGDVLLMPLRSENSYCRIFNPLSWLDSEEIPMPRLLVVGSGPAGIQIVRNLYKDFQVILVEPKDPFDVNPKSGFFFWWSKNWKELKILFARFRMICSMILINLMASTPCFSLKQNCLPHGDVRRRWGWLCKFSLCFLIGRTRFPDRVSWSFQGQNLMGIPSLPWLEHQDYYEFTPGILRGLCDAQHLETLQVKLEDALHGMGVTHIKGQVGSEHGSEALT